MSLSVASQELLLGYTRLEYLLLGDLRSILDEPDNARDNRWLLAILDSLVDTIPREFELREEGGYMDDILEQKPFLAEVVDGLHQEHERIFEMLAALRRRVSENVNTVSLVDQLRMELRDWIGMLTRHNRHEKRLFQSAFNVEIGGCN